MKTRNWPVALIRKWVEREGRTLAWVASKLGCAHQTISKVCRKHGIAVPRSGPRSGEGHKGWKGGRLIDKDGYVLVYQPNHPFARNPNKKYVLEHRLVMEHHLKRYLLPQEVVHHKNKNKQDNRLSNLELFESNAAHLKFELKGKVPKWTPEGKAAIRAGIANRVYTDEVRQRMSKAQKGKRISEETKRKISAAHKKVVKHRQRDEKGRLIRASGAQASSRANVRSTGTGDSKVQTP